MEPAKGLPAPLPDGEVVLWQGAPDRWSLARRAFHLRAFAVYFAVLLAWCGAWALSDGQSAAAAAAYTLKFTPLALAALALVALLAWLTVRTTVYTITNRRIVMRIGIALPLTVNLPFRIVDSAGLMLHADGTGDIPLSLTGNGRMAYLHLWPHARPWRTSPAEPMLRSVPDAADVAETLGRALLVSAARAAPESAKTAPSSSAAAAARPSPSRPLEGVAA